MLWNRHSELVGRHAFLSASKYHWINYDDEKMERTYKTHLAAQRGSELHAFAEMAIRLNQKMPDTRQTINMYVNDAIGFRMDTEVLLHFSDNFFGTSDAIAFRKNFLRIHDLKTGVIPGSFKQLLVYCALFCLEYGHRPDDIEIELRIYQNDDVQIYIPDPLEITAIMARAIAFDNMIDQLREEELA